METSWSGDPRSLLYPRPDHGLAAARTSGRAPTHPQRRRQGRMAISITVEIPGTPDAMTHVARIVEAVIAVDGRVTDLGRAPQLFDPAQVVDTGPLERAVSGEHAEVVSSPDQGRGRRR